MSDDSLNRNYVVLSWTILAVVICLPFIAWASQRSWRLGNVTALSIFPLLGLWAWSIMWTHYVLGTLRVINPKLNKDNLYSVVTRIVVLLLIILHPGLLIWSQWSLRRILPPSSMYDYVDGSLKLFIFFGTISLLIFLAFDILEKFRANKIISRNWFWISISQMVAMTLIFMHALALGNSFGSLWFEFYWIILGALLIPCFGLIGQLDWQNKNKDSHHQ